jgi:hypothetical protein
MAWFNKDDEVPERLKGKTPQQILQELEAADALKAKQTELEASSSVRDQEFTATKTEFEATKARLAQLEANQNRREEPPPDQRQRTGPTSVLVDEDRAFSERVGPIAALALHSGALAAKQEARRQVEIRSRDPKNKNDLGIFLRYEAEIEDLMSKEAPERKIMPQTWLNAFTYIKGIHVSDIVASVQKGESFGLEGGSSSQAPPEEPKDDKLSAEELRIAAKMRVSPENYLKQKKAMTTVAYHGE